MHTILSIVASIFAIFMVILIHECGHFLVARACGIRVLKFSIGFGKAIWSRTDRRGTLYAVGFIPLGGYVKMLGEGDTEIYSVDAKHAFSRQSVGVRIMVAMAGPLANFILAFVLFWMILLAGVAHIHPVVGKVVPGSIAAQAGVRPGERILQIGKQPTQTWQQAAMAVVLFAGDRGVMPVRLQSKHGVVERQLQLANWRLDPAKPKFFKSLGITPFQPAIPPIINKILPNSPAGSSNLKSGDRLLAINGRSLTDWVEVLQRIRKLPDQAIRLTVLRHGQPLTLSMKTGDRVVKGQHVGFLGVMVRPPKWPANVRSITHYSPWGAIVPAAAKTWHLFAFNGKVMVKMISGHISLRALGGPISIFQGAGVSSQISLTAYLSFIAFVSLALGFINILPIPILDGGHVLFCLVELVIRRPVPQRFQILAMQLGLAVLLLLMVQATLNDVLRLFF